MKRTPFRVALVGNLDRQRFGVLSKLSPAVHPILCRDWTDLESKLSSFQTELVVVLPGTDPAPLFPISQPILVLDPDDLNSAPAHLEAKILGSRAQVGHPHPLSRLLGVSLAMARVRGSLHCLSQSPLPLLLTGENGTGKDLAASLAHQLSPRAAAPFVPVNCGAIPSSLAETELFGSVRGAFTGAENRSGFCQQAWGGTLFLDEVGELPPEIQAKLLRVLENGEIHRVGSNRVEQADFRLICATNRDLEAEVAAGRFRQDLYYRIEVLPLRMPPLRERLEDIPLLAAHFLESEALGLNRPVRLGKRALAKMTDYHWPGNIRQLRNVLFRAAIMNNVTELEAHHLQWDSRRI